MVVLGSCWLLLLLVGGFLYAGWIQCGYGRTTDGGGGGTQRMQAGKAAVGQNVLLRERERMRERGVSDPCVCEFCGDDGRSSCSRRRRRLSSSPLTRMVVEYNRPKRILDGTRG